MQALQCHDCHWTRLLLTAGLTAIMLMALATACAHRPTVFHPEGSQRTYPIGTIVSGRTGEPVSQTDLIHDLASVGVVYVGETHTASAHHRVQQSILEALHDRRPGMVVGMEMFDRTYQPILNQWSKDQLEWSAFLAATHWYANWRYPDKLYMDILNSVRARKIPLIGLNIPFHLPPKIATGGLDSLSSSEKALLPAHIDLSKADHRDYVRTIFDSHHIPGRSFDNFYAAQCVWEDTMAETIAAQPADRLVVVLVGAGHVSNRYGIPDRAHARNQRPYRIVLPVSAGRTTPLSTADYFWVTAPAARRGPGMR